MSGRHSRAKGARTERTIVRPLQGEGLAATKTSGMRKRGADISMSRLGSDRASRATGFAQLCEWLNERDVIAKANWQEPLVVLRFR